MNNLKQVALFLLGSLCASCLCYAFGSAKGHNATLANVAPSSAKAAQLAAQKMSQLMDQLQKPRGVLLVELIPLDSKPEPGLPQRVQLLITSTRALDNVSVEFALPEEITIGGLNNYFSLPRLSPEQPYRAEFTALSTSEKNLQFHVAASVTINDHRLLSTAQFNTVEQAEIHRTAERRKARIQARIASGKTVPAFAQ